MLEGVQILLFGGTLASSSMMIRIVGTCVASWCFEEKGVVEATSYVHWATSRGLSIVMLGCATIWLLVTMG